MNKEKARDELIIPKLKPEEELIGFFLAYYRPSFWWYLLVGPLFALAQRTYIVGVSDKGIHFHKLTFFGRPDIYNYFVWNEIEKLELSKGFFHAPIKLVFSNNRKLKLNILLKGSGKMAKLDIKTKEFLLSKSI